MAPGTKLRVTGLLALTLVLVLLTGCNGGLLLFLLLLDDDDDDGGSGSPTEAARIEFLGIENARSTPAEARLVVLLRSPEGAPTNLKVEFLDLAQANAALGAATLTPPLPGVVSAPGTLAGVSTSAAGEEHRIGWNALADLGDDSQRRVLVRLTAFTLDLTRVLDVEVSVGNDPPEIIAVELSQEPGEDVLVRVTLADSASDPVDLDVSFSTDATGEPDPSFASATLRDAPLAPLETSADGVAHEIFWLSALDAGRVDRPAVVRLEPLDVIPGESGKTGALALVPIELDNNLAPRVVFEREDLILDPDQRRGLALRLTLHDRERNPVDLIVQWTRDGAGFPDLPPELASSAAEREALLLDPQARELLQIATLSPETLGGIVEAGSPPEAIPPDGILASWLKTAHELRGLSPADGLVGAPLRVTGTAGAAQDRRVCGYDPERGVLFVDAPFDPVPSPGSRVRLDLSSPLWRPSSETGVRQRLIWDGAADLPGGGSVSFRFTPYDRAAAAAADGCGLIAEADAPEVSRGERGTADQSSEAKAAVGPFRGDDAAVIPVAAVDTPVSITSADIDADDSLDLVYAATGFDVVVAKLQSRPGRYDELRLLDAALRAPTDVAAADLDGNGLTDIAVSGGLSDNVVVMRQLPGRDFFTARWYLHVAEPQGLAAADFDGDGALDLAALENGADDRGLVVFFSRLEDCGRREGGFTACRYPAPQVVTRLVALDCADFDDDGDLDVFGAGGGHLVVYANSGAGFDAAALLALPGSELVGVAASEVNGDGRLDLTALDSESGALLSFLGLPGGTFVVTPVVLATELGNPIALATGDFGTNERTGFVIAAAGAQPGGDRGGIRVVVSNASGRYSWSRLEEATADAPGSPSALHLADIDADGRVEIIVAETNDAAPPASSLRLYSQTPRGTFRAPAQTIPLASGGELSQPSFAAVDFRGDTYTDFITARRAANEVVVYDQVRPGGFEAVRTPLPAAARGPMAVAVGDVDGDGRADVVTANFDSGDLTVLLQAQDGSLGDAAMLAASALAGPQSVALGDVDGDGRLDIVAAGRISSTVPLFVQDAAGDFEERVDLAASLDSTIDFQDPIAVTFADMDADGALEVVTANHLSENLTILAVGGSPVVIPLGAGNRPVAIAVADVNGDERLDILSANTTGAAVTLSLATAGGDFAVSTLIEAAPDREATGLGATDLSGDGRVDVAVALAGDAPSVLRILLAEAGTGFPARRNLDLGGALDAPVGLLTVDLDGDGEPDVASVNRQSGDITVFYGGR